MDARLFINGETMAIDMALDSGALATDTGLETAVIISLFTDARAKPDDVLPDGGTNSSARRGWWGDAFPPTVDGVPVDGDRIGSRLWLLSREKIVPETLKRAKTYIVEALQWLIDEGVANRIDVAVEAQRQSVLAFEIIVHRPANGGDVRFNYLWDNQAQTGALN